MMVKQGMGINGNKSGRETEMTKRNNDFNQTFFP